MTQTAKTKPQPKAVASSVEAEGFFWHWSSDDQIETADSPSEGLWNGFFFEEVECENTFGVVGTYTVAESHTNHEMDQR